MFFWSLKLWIFNRKYQQHVGKCPDAPCMDYFPTLGEKRARSRGNVSKYFLYGTSEIWHRRNSKSFGVRILSFGAYVTHGMIRLFLYGGVHQWFLYLWRILINGGWNIFTDPWNFPAVAVRSCPLTWNTFTGIPKTFKWKEFPKINCFLWGTCGVCSRGYVGKFLEMIFSSYFGDRRSAMTQASTLVAWILLFLKMQVKVPAGPKLHGNPMVFSACTKCLLLVDTLQV